MSHKGRIFCVSNPYRSSGFSLLELMLLLCILAILSTVATPVLSGWLESSRAKSVRSQLLTAFSEARYYALTRSDTVTLCTLESSACSTNLDFPITVFVDVDGDANLDADEQILRTLNTQLPDSISLLWNRPSGYLRFWPSGGTGAITGSLSYCNASNSDQDFRLVIARTGRLRVDQRETRCP